MVVMHTHLSSRPWHITVGMSLLLASCGGDAEDSESDAATTLGSASEAGGTRATSDSGQSGTGTTSTATGSAASTSQGAGTDTGQSTATTTGTTIGATSGATSETTLGGTETGIGTSTSADSEGSGTTLGDVGSGATVTYVGKITDVSDFSAATGLDLGKHGYYFPQFGQATPKSERTAKDNMRFSKPTWQKDWKFKVFEQCGGQFCNLFSPDAGLFDILEGQEGIGVYSESEGDAWATIKLTSGSGNSGTVVDESANGNSNNSVNHIRTSDDAPAEFCMSLLTDNTAGKHDINKTLAARIGWYGDVDLETGTAKVPEEELVFNGVPDLYVFKFSNMTGEDFIKIRLNGGDGTDPGFGGLMFDPCE
jgi:hypothetical protein